MYRIILLLLIGVSTLVAVSIVYPIDAMVYSTEAIEAVDVTVYPVDENNETTQEEEDVIENNESEQQEQNPIENNQSNQLEDSNNSHDTPITSLSERERSNNEEGGGALGYLLPLFVFLLLFRKRKIV